VFLGGTKPAGAAVARPGPPGIGVLGGSGAPARHEAALAESLGLTPRQADVLDLLLQGKSAKLICRELGLAAGTVKVHTSAVLRALNVTTRTQAVVAASGLGWRLKR
jgi:DNA-binding NarL/FixJ family response regulator